MSGISIRVYNPEAPSAIGLIMGGDVENKATIVIEVVAEHEETEDCSGIHMDIGLSNIADEVEDIPASLIEILGEVIEYLKLDEMTEAVQSVGFALSVEKDLRRLEEDDASERPRDEDPEV